MIEIEFIYVCDACGTKAVRMEPRLHISDQVPKPCLPQGWVSTAKNIYCPRHECVLFDKDVYAEYQAWAASRTRGVEP